MLDRVSFPPINDPKVSALYALNEIAVNATPQTVWDLLVDAENWSSYFPPENQVTILTGERQLRMGTRYNRVTVGFSMISVVEEWTPCRRLSWSTTVEGDQTGSTAFHGWVITPTANGCHLLTEETLRGEFFLEEIGRKNPGALYRYHQDWVEMLAAAAEAKTVP